MNDFGLRNADFGFLKGRYLIQFQKLHYWVNTR